MPQQDPTDEDPTDEVAELLREQGFNGTLMAGPGAWTYIDDVQKADAVETFLREVERYACSNIEGRPISREEYDADSPRGDE